MKEEHFEVVICLYCGEKVSQKWVVCPICAHPVAETPDKQERDQREINDPK
jgi:hypothetical protein